VPEAERSDPGLTLVGDFASRWRLQADNLEALRDALGAGLFDALCTCFVHSDRLASLAQLLLLNHSQLPHASPAYGRNNLTIIWLAAGTLREMARATAQLRSALARRGWLEPNSEPIQKLRDFESRWEQSPLHRALRNSAAFHVDLSVITKGVGQLLLRPSPVLLAEGNGPTDHELSLSIGVEALLLGVDDDTQAVSTALRSVHPDHKTHLALQQLFVEALEKADVALRETPWPSPSEVM
jgi:hypothetical protein